MLSDQRASTGQLVEGGILASITVILTLIELYIPVIGLFITFVRAIPLMLLVIRHGLKLGVIGACVASVLVGMLAGPLKGIVVLISTTPIALVLGWCFREQKSSIVTLIYGSIAAVFAKLAVIGIAIAFLKIDFIDTMLSSLREAIPISIELQRRMGADQAALDLLKTLMEQTEQVMLLLIPAIFIVGATAELYVTYRVAKVILSKLKYQADEFPLFRHWDLPKGFVVGWALSFTTWKAGAYFFGTQALTYKFGANGFLLFSIALFLQGLAVLNYYFHHYQVSKPFRLMAILFILLTGSIPWFLVIYGGAYDMFFNFRRLERKG